MNDDHETNANLAEEIEDLRHMVEDFRAGGKQLHLLSAITEQVADSVITTDLDYKITYVNTSFQKIYGYSRDELIGQSPDILNASPNSKEIQKDIYETASSGGTWRGKVKNRRKDGSTFPCEITVFPVKDEKGNVFAYAGTQRNITERKKPQEALLESEERFRLLYERSPLGYQSLDADGNLIEVNPAWLSLLGYERQEVIGRPFADFLASGFPELFKERFPCFKAAGEACSVPFMMVRTDGSQIDVEIDGKIGYNPDGSFKQTHCVLRDVTERKKAEEQLEIAKQQAEAANIAKSRFLANMSHEIRTPMSVITGFANLLAMEELADEQKTQAMLIQKAGKSLLRIIDDVLDFSRIEAGRLEVRTGKFTLKKLLDRVESIMQPLAEKKGLNFKLSSSKRLPAMIHTDEDRLAQCLVNLIGNAIKFTDKGNVHLKVSLEKRRKKSFVRFDVKDTGMGIPPDKYESIFSSFTQADGSHIRKQGGTGLGLTITKELAGLLGGDLSFTSKVGAGSVFSLVIPAAADAESSILPRGDDRYEESVSESQLPDNLKFRGRVLMVEDEESSQILADRILTRLGLEVVIAANGKEAIEKTLHESWDLILMDIQMPVLNGYEAVRKLRQDGITTPVVALTACAMPQDREKCLKAGCDGYISKPFELKELQKVLSRHISIANG